LNYTSDIQTALLADYGEIYILFDRVGS